MFHVVLYEPEIPPNTGNIIRLCANTGTHLHLIEPLGFGLDDAKLKRAGLDYHEYATLKVHKDLQVFMDSIRPTRLFALSTHGKTHFYQHTYQRGDAFIFGPESRGLPSALRESLPSEFVVRIPLLPENRSLNLSNSVAIVVYEAWRQHGFAGGS
jgi:tRNA (cytidine/uridine-2'-O-)-methyltransferase